MKNSNKETGNIGEQKAKNFLLNKGYRFLASNFTYNRLEIDLIFEEPESKTIIFVEVKARTSQRFGAPEEAINKEKQRNIKIAAKYFIKFNREFNYHAKRFDSVSILIENEVCKINHIQNSY
ncbi:MAG: YraN family protein [Ignavibacteria bacterium]|jgi:putative endonuclease|nr:YraN family protein [Ignavibacteria bacterium]